MSYIIINKSVSPIIILNTNGDCSGLVCPASGAAAALLVCCPYCSTLSSDTICGVIKHWWWLECCGGPQSHCSLSPTAASVPHNRCIPSYCPHQPRNPKTPASCLGRCHTLIVVLHAFTPLPISCPLNLSNSIYIMSHRS